MFGTYRFRLALASIAMAIAGLSFNPSTVRADDPPPIDPTLLPGGSGGTVDPEVASPEIWEMTELLILSIFPEADYETVCYFALVWFNLLPPDYTPPEPPPCP